MRGVFVFRFVIIDKRKQLGQNLQLNHFKKIPV